MVMNEEPRNMVNFHKDPLRDVHVSGHDGYQFRLRRIEERLQRIDEKLQRIEWMLVQYGC